MCALLLLLLVFPLLALALTNYVGTLESRVVLPCGPPRATALQSHLEVGDDSGRITITASSGDVRLVMSIDAANGTRPSSQGYTVHGTSLGISIDGASVLWPSRGNQTRANSSCGHVPELRSSLRSSFASVTGAFEPLGAALSVTGRMGAPRALTNITFDMSFRGSWDSTSAPLDSGATGPPSTATSTSSLAMASDEVQSRSRSIRPTPTSIRSDRATKNTTAPSSVKDALVQPARTRSTSFRTEFPSGVRPTASTVRSTPPTRLLPIAKDSDFSTLLTAAVETSGAGRSTASRSSNNNIYSSRSGQRTSLRSSPTTTLSSVFPTVSSSIVSISTRSSRSSSSPNTSNPSSSTETPQRTSTVTSSISTPSTRPSTVTTVVIATPSIASSSLQSGADSQTTASATISSVAPAPPFSGSNDGESRSIPTGAIVGIAIGSTAAVALLVLASIYIWRRHRRQGHRRTVSSTQRLMGGHPEIIVLRPVSVEDERQSRSGSDPSNSTRRSNATARRDPSPFVDQLGSNTPLARESGSHLHSDLNLLLNVERNVI